MTEADSPAMRRTGRLLLLRPTADDVDALFAIHADPKTNRFNPGGPMTSHGQAERRFNDWDDHWREHGFGYWAIRVGSGHDVGQRGETGELTAPGEPVIGFAGIRFGNWRGRTVLNLYYRLAPLAWGHGYATEAATEAVSLWHDLRRERLAGFPIMAYTAPANIASQRTAAAAGLERRPDLDFADGSNEATVFALGWKPHSAAGS